MEKPQVGEVWEHYKTKGEYEIVGLGQLQVKLEELDMAECVVYKSLLDEKVWVRPLEDFTEEIPLEGGVKAKRFTKVR